MAVATMVVDCEPATAAWLEIEDDDGRRWRYGKRGDAPPSATVHVRGNHGTVGLVRGSDGKAILRQDGHGLPPEIVIQFSVSAGPPAGMGVIGSWPAGGGTYEYEQE